MSKRRRIHILKTACSIVFTVALLEAALWLLFPQGWEPEIDVSYHQDFPGLKKEMRFQKNGLGLRTLTIDTREKPPNTVRIICIGASTTEQGTQSTEDMWMAHLERMLNDAVSDSGIAIQVGAYGKGGMKMHELMRWCERDLLRLEPDIVVTLFGINSLATDEAIMGHSNFDDLRGFIKAPPSFPERYLLPYSQTYRYVRTAQENARQRAYLKKNGGLNFDIQGVTAFRRDYWRNPIDLEIGTRTHRHDLFREKTEYLLQWLLEKDVVPVVLTQPLLLHDDMDYEEDSQGRPFLVNESVIHSVEASKNAKQELEAIWFLVNTGADRLVRVPPGSFRSEMERFNQVQREVADKHGVSWVPLDERIEPTLDNFFDDCHFTDNGSKRVAEAIFPELTIVVNDRLRKKSSE